MDHKPPRHARLLQIIDLAGAFVLAIQGASIAAVKGLDAFGVVVVSLATATGGGIMRDLLIGESPPEALRGWPIVTAALLGAFVTFFAFHTVEAIPEPALIVVDALGLALLAVSGTEKALEFRLTPIAAVMMGAISGAGGYTIRDILLAEVPAVLRVDFLATAAIIGAVVLVLARILKAPANIAALLGGALRPENSRRLAALAFANRKPALTSRPLHSSEHKKNPASGGADAGQNSALWAGGQKQARRASQTPPAQHCSRFR
jgi:uncharacterized membrane protein YeiH